MAALLAGVAIFAQTPLPEPAPHPRLFLSDRDFDEIRARVANPGTGDHASPHHTALAAMHELIMVRAATAGLSDAPLSMAFDAGGLRMLDTSRSALERILLCSYAYRFSGERRFLDHAASDLRAVCSFSNWNADRHFLDTAEMALAVGIGYDWLYDELCEDDRSAIISALERNAFDPAADEDTAWFYYAEGNWNQVCNAGLAAAALAIQGDRQADLTIRGDIQQDIDAEKRDSTVQSIIDDAIWSNRRAMQAIYSPSGCYVEGPNYWNYGNAFQVLLLTLLEQTFGSDFGLSETPGFRESAFYRTMVRRHPATVSRPSSTDFRPAGHIFNYSDNVDEFKPAYALWYFADRFGDESLVSDELEMLLGSRTADEAGGSSWTGTDGWSGIRYDESSEVRLLPLFMKYLLRGVPGGASKAQAVDPEVRAGCPGTSEDRDSAAEVRAGSPGTSEVQASSAEVHTGDSGTSAHPQIYINRGRPGILEDMPLMIVKGSDYYLGVKGGSPTANHAHMDGGSFVYDAFGQVWAIDPDRDSYQELEAECKRLGGDFWDMSQESVRWKMPGMNNRSHSTITVNDRDFNVKGKAELTGTISSDSKDGAAKATTSRSEAEESGKTAKASNGAILDLSSLYEGELAAAERRISVDGNGNLTVEDRLTALPGKDADIRWSFVTPAEVTVSRRGIMLKNGGTMVLLRTKSRTRVTYREFPSGSETYRICGFEAKVREGKTVVFRSRIEGK